MSLNLFLDPITRDKIIKILKTDSSDALYTFIYEAIHEKLNQDEVTLGGVTEHVKNAHDAWNRNSVAVKVSPISDKSLKILESLMEQDSKKYEGKEFPQEDIYGPGAAGLIWIFHNRYFPVKIVLNIVAQLMVRENKTWLNLDEYRDDIIDALEIFVSEIYQNKSVDSDAPVGFPLPEKVLFERYQKMRKERPKSYRKNIRPFRGSTEDKIKQLVASRLRSSRLRFFSQFIGKSLEKEHGRVYSGACFEMGLLVARGEKRNLEITFSKNGFDFTKLKNPIMTFLENGEELEDKDTFSEEERNFILEKILVRYKLESRIMKILHEWSEASLAKGYEKMTDLEINTRRLKLRNKTRDMLKHKKRTYLMEKFPDIMDTKQKYSISDEDVTDWLAEVKIEKKPTANVRREFKELGFREEDVLEYLVYKHLEFQVVGIMSRFYEFI